MRKNNAEKPVAKSLKSFEGGACHMKDACAARLAEAFLPTVKTRFAVLSTADTPREGRLLA